jgi:hypothetical protein
MTGREDRIVRFTVLRPLTVRGEKYFVISVNDFKELILTTQYKDAVFSSVDRVCAP